jgi:hypothetical protein
MHDVSKASLAQERRSVKKPFHDEACKTRQKAKSAQNALRHGLTTVSRPHPAYHDDIVQLALLMCGDGTDPALFERAAEVAECDILIREIRQYRDRVLERFVDPESWPTAWASKERKGRLWRMTRAQTKAEGVLAAHPQAGTSPEERAKFDELMKEYWTVGKDRAPDDVVFMALKDIDRLSRYERRAWSRRNRAFLQYLAFLVGYRIQKPVSPDRFQSCAEIVEC